jgi:hypothetical protein
MINITIGMPEFLLLFSAAMYNQSWGLSILALSLAIIGRTTSNLVDYGKKNQDNLEEK